MKHTPFILLGVVGIVALISKGNETSSTTAPPAKPSPTSSLYYTHLVLSKPQGGYLDDSEVQGAVSALFKNGEVNLQVGNDLTVRSPTRIPQGTRTFTIPGKGSYTYRFVSERSA